MNKTITYEAEASSKKQVKKYQIFSYVVTLKCFLICRSTTTRCQGAPWRGPKSFTHPWTRLELFSLSPSRMNQWCHQNWFSLSDHFLSPWLLSWRNVLGQWLNVDSFWSILLCCCNSHRKCEKIFFLFCPFFFFSFFLFFLPFSFPFFSFFPFSFLFSLLFSLHFWDHSGALRAPLRPGPLDFV